jgi:hypothetical protein
MFWLLLFMLVECLCLDSCSISRHLIWTPFGTNWVWKQFCFFLCKLIRKLNVLVRFLRNWHGAYDSLHLLCIMRFMCFRCSPFIWSIVLSCLSFWGVRVLRDVVGGLRCSVVFGYFNPLLECPTATRVLWHVWGYLHHTTFKTHLERNIIIVIEDSNIYTNFSRNYIIFLSYSVPTAETCGARHVVPTHFLVLFFLPPPIISPSHYQPLYPHMPLFLHWWRRG